jgi:hypothetical protein
VIVPAKPRPRPATSVGKRVTLYASHIFSHYLPPDIPVITFNNSLETALIPVVMAEAEDGPVGVEEEVEEAAPQNATAAAK